MIRRNSTIHSIAWFLDQYRSKKLILDPPYQRHDFVWGKTYKVYFIDTILQNYPAPAIFLHVETSPEGITLFQVVDGKQRLTTIFEFIKGDFTVTGSDIPEEYSGIEFNDLKDDLKTDFYGYQMPVQEVFSSSHKDLRTAFDRLNRNVARLSKQELRHALFFGEFLDEMERLADEPFWEDIGIATKANIKRMRNVEFTSEIFALTMQGVQEGTKNEVLDEFYRNYEEEIPDKDEHMRNYRSCMRILENFNVRKIRSSRYKNLSDFYSLWVAILPHVSSVDSIDYETSWRALKKFENDYAKYIKNPDPELAKGNPGLIKYYDNARQGVNKAANRQNRADVLTKLIKIK